MNELTHIDDEGHTRMVDVGAKAKTRRLAIAGATVQLSQETMRLLSTAALPKGDALATAKIAGIMAAKRTAELIPLCHPLPLGSVSIDLALSETGITATATAATTGPTGVEMEALTAVSVAGLAVVDMVKGLDRSVQIESVRLVAKEGGRSGTWRADDA